HGDDPRHRACFVGVDRADDAVGDVGSDEHGVERPVELDVGEVTAGTGEQARVFGPGDPIPQDRSADRRGGHRAVGWWGSVAHRRRLYAATVSSLEGAPTDASTRALARRLTFEVYIPWILAQLGRGMLVPVVPLYLRDAGLSYTRISVILAALGLGAVIGGLPTGAIAARVGPEWLFVGATTATAVTAALLGVSTAVLGLVAFRLVYGAGAV